MDHGRIAWNQLFEHEQALGRQLGKDYLESFRRSLEPPEGLAPTSRSWSLPAPPAPTHG